MLLTTSNRVLEGPEPDEVLRPVHCSRETEGVSQRRPKRRKREKKRGNRGVRIDRPRRRLTGEGCHGRRSNVSKTAIGERERGRDPRQLTDGKIDAATDDLEKRRAVKTRQPNSIVKLDGGGTTKSTDPCAEALHEDEINPLAGGEWEREWQEHVLMDGRHHGGGSGKG